MKKIKIGISSCLLGENVRYDGTNKRNDFLVDVIGQYVQWVPVCPEVECGLSVPREPMRLYGNPDDPRIITIGTEIEHTAGLRKWTAKKLEALKTERLSAFIFKVRSPSCGTRGVEIVLPDGQIGKTSGIFCREFMMNFPDTPVTDEESVDDPIERENFFKELFGAKRWNGICKE